MTHGGEQKLMGTADPSMETTRESGGYSVERLLLDYPPESHQYTVFMASIRNEDLPDRLRLAGLSSLQTARELYLVCTAASPMEYHVVWGGIKGSQKLLDKIMTTEAYIISTENPYKVYGFFVCVSPIGDEAIKSFAQIQSQNFTPLDRLFIPKEALNG